VAGATAAQQPVTVIGDSVIAWNRSVDRSVADALAILLDRPVRDASVPGARISHPSGLARVGGLEVRRQRITTDGGWVVADGGANDLLSECACNRCGGKLNELATPDGRSGEIPAFVADLLARGHRVVWVGYYGPSGLGGSFDRCDDELQDLNGRLSRLADRYDDVLFIPVRDLFGPANRDRYDDDQVHPSPKGSVEMARRVARAILRAEAQ